MARTKRTPRKDEFDPEDEKQVQKQFDRLEQWRDYESDGYEEEEEEEKEDVYRKYYPAEKLVHQKLEQAAEKFPKFWKTVILQSHIAEWIRGRETRCLRYVKRVKFQYLQPEEMKGGLLELHFELNPFFKNEKLIKQEIGGVYQSTVILWKFDHNNLIDAYPPRPNSPVASTSRGAIAAETDEPRSFFTWFADDSCDMSAKLMDEFHTMYNNAGRTYRKAIEIEDRKMKRN